MKNRTRLVATLCASTVLLPQFAMADPSPTPAMPRLEEQFRDPPQSARPRVWWHWMNGNITMEGIAKDLDWMHRIGIGGLQNFDANLATPQIVPRRLVYMAPEWKEAFRFAVTEADRQGIEFGIASSPGWSETGGPWVPPEDGMKKLVWSEILLAPGKHFAGRLPAAPSTTGPFQTMHAPPSIEDMISGGAGRPRPKPQAGGVIRVLAIPALGQAPSVPQVSLGDGQMRDGASLFDADPETGLDLPRGTATAPTRLLLSYGAPQTIRSVTMLLPGAVSMFAGPSVAVVLEASDDGAEWRKVIDIPVSTVEVTRSFALVTARQFRLVLSPLAAVMSNAGGAAPGVDTWFLAAMASAAGAPLRLCELRLSAVPRIDRFETKAGFATSLDYYALGDPGDGAVGPGPGQVIDLTARVAPDGKLDWTPPRLPSGQAWRVIRLGWSLTGTTNHPATPEATGLEVDKFDGAAVGRYMDHYLGMYRDAVGPDLVGAHGIHTLVTDSTEVGAANWTPAMIAQFTRLRGYDPTPWLPALTGALVGSRADSDCFLYDFRRTIADLTASQHYATVDNAARAAGLTVYGEALEDHRPSLGDDMEMRSHTDVPMSAMWRFPKGGAPNPSYLADTKGASSVAHIWGQNLVAAESMTSMLTPWADSPQTLKHIIDLEFLQGINRPVIHESTHQPEDDKVPGLSLMIFGQYFNRLDSWAEMARPWVDYIARNALMLQQGRNVADVAYFYGEEAPLTGLYGDHPVADAPTTHAYDFINASALMTALANDGADLVTPGGARYQALYLGGSSSHMTLAALRRIAALAESGATVVGLAPTGSPSQADATPEARAAYAALLARLWPGGGQASVGKGRVIAASDIEAAMAGAGIAPDFTFSGGTAQALIPFVHSKLADGEDYFIVNRGSNPETMAAHFRVTGKAPELWHAETGDTESVSYRIANGETVVPLTLAPDDSVHIVFRKPTSADAVEAKPAVPAEIARLDGAWTVSFQPGRGAPASVVLPALAPLERNADPGIRYFSGIATYTKDFTAPKGWKPGQPVWLDLGDVHELAEVWVNGKLAGSAWHAPFRVDIGAATHRGMNHLEIRVANLWVNRLIGDAQPGVTRKITRTALPTYRADAPLVPSGLIGPVTLSTVRYAGQ